MKGGAYIGGRRATYVRWVSVELDIVFCEKHNASAISAAPLTSHTHHPIPTQSQPPSQPASHPASQPASQPPSQPASHPVSQPATQPATPQRCEGSDAESAESEGSDAESDGSDAESEGSVESAESEGSDAESEEDAPARA